MSDLEAIKAVYTDPVKGLSGIGQYNEDIITFQNSLNAVNAYFTQKLGTKS
jgi:hypothetical protein